MSADDGHGLAELGYKQEFERTLGNFHTFAAGISYISILTGTFQMFYFGFSIGGPANWWSWPMVFVGQLMIALCFAELSARYPVAGSIYNWSKRLGSPHVAWLAGWMMLVASVVTVASVALAYQITLPQIADFFQIAPDNAVNAVILGTVLIVFSTAVNAWSTKLMARINSAGVFIELVAAVLLVVMLGFAVVRGPQIVLDTAHKGDGVPLGYFGAFLVGSLASAYVMYGFDTASSLGEESVNPRKNAPRAILRALIASFVIGGLILLLALMAVRNINAPELSKVFLVAVAIAITVCILAVHTAAIRMTFAMARDNNLPAGAWLAKVHGKQRTPVRPAVLIGIIAVILLVVNIGQPQIFQLVTSIGVVLIYVAYLLVTLPMLVARLRGTWPGKDAPKEGFSLGRWGLPVNILAVLWGAGMAINLAWPRSEVYNPTPPFHWFLQWGAVLFVGLVALLGFGYYWIVLRHKTGVLADHAAEVPAVTAEEAV
jgi:urea carboxylase system permease